MRKLLGFLIGRFVLSGIRGRSAKTKHKIIIKGNKVKIFGSDFVATGYLI